MIRRLTPGLGGVLGLGVLVVVMQSSGGFGIELLGPDILLAATGFAVTFAVLDEPDAEALNLRRWYRRQAALGTPLLVIVPAVVLAAMALIGPYAQVGRTTTQQLRAVLTVPGPSVAELWDRIDPLGALWLVELLVLFGAIWPLLLVALRKLLVPAGRAELTAPILIGVAAMACLVAPLRTLAGGASVTELTLGPHVRAGEWLVGAAAAAVVVAVGRRRVPRRAAGALAVSGGLLVAGMIIIAAIWPLPWLAAGGPAVAALGVSLLLVAAFTHDKTLLDDHLGVGLPAEIARMTFPLLMLHCPVFWAIQLMVPDVRPFALLVIGGLFAWFLGLLLQDGVVKRVNAQSEQLRRVLAAVVLTGAAIVTCAVAGERVAAADQRLGRDAPHPTVLVLGDSLGNDLSAQLLHSRYTVVDGSVPGCGLLAAPSGFVRTAQTTDLAQAPATARDCTQWPNRWREQVASVAPAAIIVTLEDDSTSRPGLPPPCDPAFRALYRQQFAKAVALWSAGDPTRPVLLAVPSRSAASGDERCYDALLAESAGSYRGVVPLDPQGSVAAAVTDALVRTAPNR